ncbi:MAG: peptidoglycan-binding protein [Gracilibacteraceae bacterium]|nr:peptidoglycan-binding protein [Gracilibacteraceae bacterium]
MKIFINPGHGPNIIDAKGEKPYDQSYDPGAVGLNGYQEATVNLSIANKLIARLNDHVDLKLYQSGGIWRGPNDYTLKDICEAANNWEADCLISIHASASNDRASQGISTHYQMMGSRMNTVKYDKGKKLAEITHNHLINEFGDYGITYDKGLIVDNFQILRDTKCPGVLVEIGYISNPLDELKMQKDPWQDAAAYALMLALNDYLGLGLYPYPCLPNTGKTLTECPYNEPETDVQIGSKGNDVRWVQWQLNLCGFVLVVDGDFGSSTETAVRSYQKNIALPLDGIVGANTRKLLRTVAESCPYREPTDNILMGSKGNNVRWVQWHLNRMGINLDTDGDFGPLPDFVVKEFQKSNHLTADGIVGPQTRTKLKSITRTCPYNEPRKKLHQRNAGAGVCWVQWHLNRNGADLAIDGTLGSATTAAIRTFQKDNTLASDGVVGPLTRAALKK